MGKSNIDITLATESIRHQTKNWSVIDLTESNHKVPTFQIIGSPRHEEIAKDDKFCTRSHLDVSMRAKGLITALRKAALDSIPTRISNKISSRLYWWSAECSESKAYLNRQEDKCP